MSNVNMVVFTACVARFRARMMMMMMRRRMYDVDDAADSTSSCFRAIRRPRAICVYTLTERCLDRVAV